MGAGSESGCGVNSKILTGTSQWQKINVPRMPYFSMVSGKRSYPACYYEINVEKYKYKSGKITIIIDNAADAEFYIFGGTDRKNASIAVNRGSNSTFRTGQVVDLDVSMGAVILI